MQGISDKIVEIQARLAAAAARGGTGACPQLLAVSKTFPAEVVCEAARTPHRLFGESRVQELLAKAPLCPSHLEWHFIGHLQKNKIRRLLGVAKVIHSVDSLELAQAIDRIAGEEGVQPDVYLQVNIAEDVAKFGFTRDTVSREYETLLNLQHVNIIGLMTIPPLVDNPEKNRRHFAALRELRDELTARSGVPLPGLSMGMSDDFEIAAEEGATIVRVGSLLFGNRPPAPSNL